LNFHIKIFLSERCKSVKGFFLQFHGTFLKRKTPLFIINIPWPISLLNGKK